jgi:hypothetical protein
VGTTEDRAPEASQEEEDENPDIPDWRELLPGATAPSTAEESEQDCD